MKIHVLVLVVILSTLSLSFLVSFPVHANTQYGPRIDQLKIKIYDSATAEFTGLRQKKLT